SCGHAWYQTAQVEQLDLAAVMGNEYAAQREQTQAAAARTAAGAAAQQRGAAPAARAPMNTAPRAQGAPMGMPGQAPGGLAPPVPPGAVSMMRRVQGAAGAQPGQGWAQHPGAPPVAGTAMTRTMPPGANAGPMAAQLAAQTSRNQAGAQAVGDTVVSWTRGAAQPGMMPPRAPGMPGQ